MWDRAHRAPAHFARRAAALARCVFCEWRTCGPARRLGRTGGCRRDRRGPTWRVELRSQSRRCSRADHRSRDDGTVHRSRDAYIYRRAAGRISFHRITQHTGDRWRLVGNSGRGVQVAARSSSTTAGRGVCERVLQRLFRPRDRSRRQRAAFLPSAAGAAPARRRVGDPRPRGARGGARRHTALATVG